MKVEQHFYDRVYNVYNVEGTLILTEESRAPDLVRELIRLRAEIDQVPELAAPTREQVKRELEAAESEAQSAQPKGAAIKAHLDNAAGTLESATSVAERAGKLATTLFSMGKWAVTLLA
jgi:multidrug resistance efflux pump